MHDYVLEGQVVTHPNIHPDDMDDFAKYFKQRLLSIRTTYQCDDCGLDYFTDEPCPKHSLSSLYSYMYI